jgi:hypothetical protein
VSGEVEPKHTGKQRNSLLINFIPFPVQFKCETTRRIEVKLIWFKGFFFTIGGGVCFILFLFCLVFLCVCGVVRNYVRASLLTGPYDTTGCSSEST